MAVDGAAEGTRLGLTSLAEPPAVSADQFSRRCLENQTNPVGLLHIPEMKVAGASPRFGRQTLGAGLNGGG